MCAFIIATVLGFVAGAAGGGERAVLTVLFTSDMHAHVLPYDEIRDKPSAGSIAQVATVAARVRAENPRTVVLDGGDAIQGTPMGFYAIAAPGAPGLDPTIAAMNLVGYDAAALGNHEFNFGLDVLRRSLSQAHFPWLAANLGGAAETKLPVQDEVVIERSGIRVGVLGLTNPNIPHWDPPAHRPGLTFLDPVAVASQRIPALRARADLVIVVVHAGFERDLVTGISDGSENENFGWRLAQLEGIDLLLTGHTHRDIPPQALGKTVVAQPGRWGDTVTRVDITLERTDAAWRVASWKGENLKTAQETPDPHVAAAVESARARALAELTRTVGTLGAPVVVGGVPTRDDAGVDLIHAVQLEASGAQLSLASPLGMARLEFPAGPVTPRLAHALYPYANTLVVVSLTGAQIKEVLEHAVSGWVKLDCARPAPCALLRDPHRPGYNFDTLEGATYFVDPTAPVGARIRGLRVAGQPIDPQATFTVVINSYRSSGGGGYPYLAGAPRVAEIDRPMTDLIVNYFTKHHSVTPLATDNWAFTFPVADGVVSETSQVVK